MEKEAIPRWNKFLQGYYDDSTVQESTFDQAVSLRSEGGSVLNEELARDGVRMMTAYPPVFGFMVFNMSDPVVGGYEIEKRKLRQALSIAIDVEEEIAIFYNGLGIPAQGPIPPGIFGYESGRDGTNRFVYRWDEATQKHKLRPIEDAKKLLAEAGYPGGFGADGRPLEITYVCGTMSPSGRSRIDFIRKQLRKINVMLKLEVSDGNRFWDKINSGTFQLVQMGWMADYPDPENFLFLFESPEPDAEGRILAYRYSSFEYDALFRRMRALENGPERMAIIRKAVDVLREDAPTIFTRHPVTYGLYHDWYRNVCPAAMCGGIMKYARIDSALREKYRDANNQPVIWPVVLLLVIAVAIVVPAMRLAARHFREI
jgi:ABC-type transport system substrate-binding protein